MLMEHMDPQELQYLSDTLQAAGNEISRLEQKADDLGESIIAAKQEMHGETSQSIGNLWTSDAFEQLVELSQFATEISRDVDAYENTMKEIERLKNILDSPYFARIDFQLLEEDAPRRIYIGRATLMQDYNIYIYDWRAPIASMFYRFGPGSASYEAPAGTIRGTISLKRQYEIKHGELVFYFDADIEILDEYLRRMLSQNASPQMKNIVETIQREQDVAIRDVEHDILVVQGVAGSGKTSIALHRIAYLLYNGLAQSLLSQHVLILSPNAVFESYISHVLPELGEEHVQSLLLDDIFQMVLQTPHVQTRYDMLEAWMLRKDSAAPALKSSLKFKCSSAFKQILDKLEIRGSSLPDIQRVYQRLFSDGGRFAKMAEGVPLPPDIADILRITNENLASPTLAFDDASALTYLFLKRNGSDSFRHIRQVVVDEVQDYYPLHFEICKLLFPNAQYTLLGDITQTIGKPEGMAFYEDVMRIFNKRKSALVTLEKSFRCSNEIIRFSADILGAQIRAFGREGELPMLHRLKFGQDAAPVAREIAAAKAAGYQSIGILCKSGRECRELHALLGGGVDVRLLQDTADTMLSGAFLLPVYLSKGLEFDAVFIWGADSAHYHTQADRSLLFIGCTRALHRLRLFYAGEPSAFIGPANCGQSYLLQE